MRGLILPKKITKLYSLGGLVSNAAYFLAGMFTLNILLQTFVKFDSPPNLLNIYMVLVVVFVLVLIRRWYIEKSLVTSRKAFFEQLAEQEGYSAMSSAERLQAFGKAILNTLEASKALEWSNTIKTDAWAYCDYRYEVHRKAKSGSYKSADIYYGVMSAPLNRQLPHVFFDSLKARKRQFRFVFAGAQQHSLEGTFDQHFVTYFPEGYTIDSMSFITPDVMWEIQQADQYDVEIAQDRLYIYGPLYEPKQQLEDMSKALMNIRSKLIDNIDTYRDERLPMEKGRSFVALQGMLLKRSRLLKIMATVFGILYLLAAIALQAMAK